MNGTVYHAFDTTNGKSYVGQTWDWTGRFQAHRYGSRRNKPVTHFHRALKKRYNEFVWTVLTTDIQTQRELDDAEVYWGTHFDALHPAGYSHVLGRGSGRLCAETKSKISAALRGRKLDETRKRKLSEAARGLLKTPEHRANISASLRGKHLSEETRAKMSASRMGHITSAETRAKISAKARQRSEMKKLVSSRMKM